MPHAQHNRRSVPEQDNRLRLVYKLLVLSAFCEQVVSPPLTGPAGSNAGRTYRSEN